MILYTNNSKKYTKICGNQEKYVPLHKIQPTMKRITLLTTALMAMILSTTAQPAKKTVKLKVIETSDVH